MSKRNDEFMVLVFLRQEYERSAEKLTKAEFEFIKRYAKFKPGDIVLYQGKKYQLIQSAKISSNTTDLLYRLHAFTLKGDRPKQKEYYRDIYVEEAKLELYEGQDLPKQ